MVNGRGIWSDAGAVPSSISLEEGHAVRRRSAWLIALPLVVIGSLVAHQLAYRIVAGAQADALLADTGHGYLEQVPTGAVLSAICLLIGIALAMLDHVRGAVGQAVPAWLIALVPVAGFAIQEHAERLFFTGQVPWAAALDATFLVGLALQLPFAALAFVVARALLRTVAAVVAALLDRSQQHARQRRSTWQRGDSHVVLPTGLARTCAPRGPPGLLTV